MKIFTIKRFVLAQLIYALPLLAINLEDFTQSEYGFNIQEPQGMKIAPDALSGKREKLYSFINFEPQRVEKLVVYLDTKDLKLSKESLIIRVREDRSNPKKSKITVKLRSSTVDNYKNLKNNRKGEIDIIGGKKAYSPSWDIRFDPQDIDIHNVNINDVIELIKTNKDAWAVVEPRLGDNAKDLKQTIVMRALYWFGTITKIHGVVEADYSIWSPYSKVPHVAFTSLSFKGKTDDANLILVAERVAKALEQKHIAVPADKSVSKTKKVFDMSPNFQ